jgi:vitamin K-dependent gamma-carboxylase
MTTSTGSSNPILTDAGNLTWSEGAGLPTSAILFGRLFAPVDAASLALFRIGFGLVMAWWAIDYLTTGRVQNFYVTPKFHFTYYLFDFVRPWPGAGMQWHFVALTLLALAIAAGLLYRVAAVLFALGFTYVFLLDRTNYQNHYYLVALVSWLLTLLPLNRTWSVDALESSVPRAPTLPAWMLWLVRFHVALPYVFGGLAKFDADWFAGAAMRQLLATHSGWPIVGPWFQTDAAIACFLWGGLLFDLTIVPLLLWRPTRGLAYVLCLGFHALNAVLFHIHIFPWLMMAATTVFFEPDWPRRLLGMARMKLPAPTPLTWSALSRGARAGLMLACVYCGFHVVWPLRHHVYAGNSSWNERGHYFSWRMMLRGKTSAVRYYLTDPKTGETWHPNLRPYLTVEQVGKFSRDPEMILHLAHFLAAEERRLHGREVEVRALVLTSLNGRKPELLIDPNVDLVKEPRGLHVREWIMPQTEPLPAEPWTVPLVEWERHVTLPPLKFLPTVRPVLPTAAATEPSGS